MKRKLSAILAISVVIAAGLFGAQATGVAQAHRAHFETYPYTGIASGLFCPRNQSCQAFYLTLTLAWAFNLIDVRPNPVSAQCSGTAYGGDVGGMPGYHYSATSTYKSVYAARTTIELTCGWDIYAVDSFGDATKLGTMVMVGTGNDIGTFSCTAYPSPNFGVKTPCVGTIY